MQLAAVHDDLEEVFAVLGRQISLIVQVVDVTVPKDWQKDLTERPDSPNDLDPTRRSGRRVTDGAIPHGFHTKKGPKMQKPASPGRDLRRKIAHEYTESSRDYGESTHSAIWWDSNPWGRAPANNAAGLAAPEFRNRPEDLWAGS